MNISAFMSSFFLGSNKKLSLFLLTSGIAGLIFLYLLFQRPYTGFGIPHSLVFYASNFSLVFGIISLLISFLGISKEAAQKIWLLSITVFISLSIGETALRIKGINDTYPEMLNGFYLSPNVQRDNNIYRTYVHHSIGYVYAPEFRYIRHHNNYGFSGNDFNPRTDSSEILIQTYGDSFTEGDGAAQDSCYPSVLQSIFKEQKRNEITVQNFGICGNDPGFYFTEMRDIGKNLKPDIAVLSYGSGDFSTDFFCRGGLERFKQNYWQCYPGPVWEWIYASSHLFRLCIHSLTGIKFNYFLTDEKTREARFRELEPKWNQVFLKLSELARQNNIKILLLKKPEHSEVDLNQYEYDFTFFEKMADTINVFKRYDLLGYYRDSVFMNRETSHSYFWIKDGHHNAAGYAVMAKGVYCGLQKSYPEIFTTLDSTKTKR